MNGDGNKEDILIACILLAIALVLVVLTFVIVPEVLTVEKSAVIEIHSEWSFLNLPKTAL